METLVCMVRQSYPLWVGRRNRFRNAAGVAARKALRLFFGLFSFGRKIEGYELVVREQPSEGGSLAGRGSAEASLLRQSERFRASRFDPLFHVRPGEQRQAFLGTLSEKAS